ncbi:MAG: homoserine kinase [Gemmatimonadales bacterium]
MRETSHSVTASAPGSIGNVGPGLDVLGLALEGPRDEVTLRFRSDTSDRILDAGHPDLPTDPTANTASVAARAVLRHLGVEQGIDVTVVKGLPLAGGQGGSAASAVAGAVAAAVLLQAPLEPPQILGFALEGEMVASGRQADNLAPSLLGGLILVRSTDPVETIRLPLPAGLHVVLAHPAQRLETRVARGILPTVVSREVAIRQAANLATVVAGACLDNLALLGRGIDDLIAEPVRAGLLPGFSAAKAAALGAGAAGCSISGAGPTAFAFAGDRDTANRVAGAMKAAYRDAGVVANVSVTTPSVDGARSW